MRKSTFILGALIVAGAALWYTRGQESQAARDDEASPTDSTEHRASGQNKKHAPSANLPTTIVPVKRAAQEATPEEQGVLTMYDEIAVILLEQNKSCDEIGHAFADSVHEHADQVSAWAQVQMDMDDREREAAALRLTQAAGARMERAQDAIRRAMGKCSQSKAFQEALRELTMLGSSDEPS